jgi:hypothetical protein
MSALFAHHLEFHHIPILSLFFIAGLLIGWQNMGRFFKR